MIFATAIVLAARIGLLAPDPGGVWQLWVSESPGSAIQVTQGDTDIVWLSETADDGSLVATRADGTAIVFDADLEAQETIELGRGSDRAALSPDGRFIAYSRTLGSGARHERDIGLYDRQLGQHRPLIARAGLQHSPAWGPDGTSLAYSEGRPDSGQSLWIRQLDGSHEEQVTVGNQFDLEPTVATDGTLYFSSNRDGDYDVYRLTGGTTIEKIADSPGYDGVPRVSRDGRRILFVSDRSGQRGIWTTDADGAVATVWPTGTDTVRAPTWLLDAQPLVVESGWIAHLRVGADGRWQPWTMRTDGSGERQIVALPRDPSRLSVTSDGKLLLACASDGTIYLVDIAAGSFEEIVIEPGGSTDAAISPDGASIAFSASTLGGIDTNDIWLAPVAGGTSSKLTHQNYMQHFPTWAPNGDLLYLSGRGGQVHDIWRIPSGGGTPAEVLADHRYNFEPTVSPQGAIAFSSNASGGYDLYLREDDGGDLRPVAQHSSYDGQPSFSPSGGQIVFTSRRSGGGHLWIVDVGSNAVRPLTTEGEARMPVWYVDGAIRDAVTENRE